MNYLKVGWLSVATLLSIPYLALLIAGSWWFWRHGWLWQWMVLSGVCVLLGWGVLHWLRRQRPTSAPLTAQPSDQWPPSGRRAWEQVNALAERIQTENPPLDRPEAFWDLLREVLNTVATQYHPKSRHAMLEIPVPHVLRIVELVAADLRVAFAQHVPGAHVLTLHDFRRFSRLASWYDPLYFLYRVVAFGINPVSGILRELRDLAGGELYHASTGEIRRWAVGFCVRKAGFYAIQLYSGQLVLDEVEFQDYRSARTQRDTRQSQTRDEVLAEEPLRILVLGQVKAGKSSLINALFGEMRAAVDVVPRTRMIEPFLLEREGVARAIVLDTAGYAGTEPAQQAFAHFREEILRTDLILLVCSACSAARGPDRRLLEQMRDFFQREPDRMMPPVVVAVSFIDRLRPVQEWNPPYDLAHPQSVKARHIREAVEAVREDLALAPEQVMVPVCLAPGRVYNVEEGLTPAILHCSPEAQRVKYLRCLRSFHEETYWRQLWGQAVNSGRVLLKAGLNWARSD